MCTRYWSVFCFFSGLIVTFSVSAVPPSEKRLWVLQAPGQMVEYDPSTWTAINKIKVPPEFLLDPENLQVNRSGQMLFYSDPRIQFGDPDRHFPSGKLWLWNGRSALILDRFPGDGGPPPTQKNATVEHDRRWALSRDGGHLYCFENEFRIIKNAEGVDGSVSASFRVWETDLAGGQASQIAQFSFPKCECGTGVCSETCPEAGVWVPDEGLDDFFVVSHWIPGQIGTTYQSSHVYKKTTGKWLARKLTQALEEIQDAAQGGAAIIHRILDGGCCGWDNEGNDQTIFDSSGRSIILFDEHRRYKNLNYDVSFFTSNVKFSPDGPSIALTIASTSLPGSEIRLSSEGKPDAGELARIRQSLAGLPAVEIIGGKDFTNRLAWLPNAVAKGWLSPSEILIVANGALAVFDVKSGVRRTIPVTVAKESTVFLR